MGRGLLTRRSSSGGSAGSVLRSQGTLGLAELSRWRARGIRMSTFQCSLRPGPAAASWIGGRKGVGPSHLHKRGHSHLFPKAGGGSGTTGEAKFLGGAPRDQSCARRERWGWLSFRAGARGGSGCRRSNARSGPVPLPLRGSAGSLGDGEAFGVPQRGTADKPGVKTRVWRTTFRFTEEKHPRRNGCACAIAYSKNPRMAVITRST